MSLAPQHIATLLAAADRIVPADDAPGAVASGAAATLIAALDADLAHLKNEYTLFLAQLDVEAQVAYGNTFVQLPPEKQDALLNTFQTSAFFHMLVEHVQEQFWATDAGSTLVGFYTPPPLPDGGKLGERAAHATVRGGR